MLIIPRRFAPVLATIVVASAVVLSGCGGDGERAEPIAAAAPDATAPDHGLVTPDQAARLAASGVPVIDVRTPEEFAGGHVEGATLIDFYSPTFDEAIAALDPAGEYLVYCRSGNRSAQAVALMAQHGIRQVWELDGGIDGAGGALTLVR